MYGYMQIANIFYDLLWMEYFTFNIFVQLLTKVYT